MIHYNAINKIICLHQHLFLIIYTLVHEREGSISRNFLMKCGKRKKMKVGSNTVVPEVKYNKHSNRYNYTCT
jgi:predicted metalloprotease